jgi:hypothetical protein
LLSTMTGQSAALGVLAALHRRARTGQGGLVTADLARTSGYLQVGLFARADALNNDSVDTEPADVVSRASTESPTWLQDALSEPAVAARGLVEVRPRPAEEGGTESMTRQVGPGPWLSRSALGRRSLLATSSDDPLAFLDLDPEPQDNDPGQVEPA